MLNAYPLIVLVGPTGAGKSALALSLAGAFGGEIVNCDSVQVYRGLDIGSAKTPESERLCIAHHLLDIISPKAELTAADYARMATAILRAIRARSVLPVIVGGTGFYLRALLDGLSPAPGRNLELRKRLSGLEARRPAALHRFLRTRDPAAAARIHPNDRQKLVRAIELAGEAVGPRQGLAGFRVLKIGLSPERAALYERLNRRSEWMFENGLIAETQALLDGGISVAAKALGTLGYRHALKVLTQGMGVKEAIEDCQRATRRYAKRQITWFRAEAEVQWLAGFGDESSVQHGAAGMVRSFLCEGCGWMDNLTARHAP